MKELAESVSSELAFWLSGVFSLNLHKMEKARGFSSAAYKGSSTLHEGFSPMT
jgi:hypothetical protein